MRSSKATAFKHLLVKLSFVDITIRHRELPMAVPLTKFDMTLVDLPVSHRLLDEAVGVSIVELALVDGSTRPSIGRGHGDAKTRKVAHVGVKEDVVGVVVHPHFTDQRMPLLMRGSPFSKRPLKRRPLG